MRDVNILEKGQIDYRKGIEILGDIETYDDMIDEFLTEIDEKINNLKKFKDLEDMENYAIAAHSLKSDSKYFGFSKLAEIAFEHEMAGKEKDVDKVKDDFSNFMSEVNRIIEVVKQYRGV